MLPSQCEIAGSYCLGLKMIPTVHTSAVDTPSTSFTFVIAGPGMDVQVPRCSCAIRVTPLASAPAAQTSPDADTRTLASVPRPRPVAAMCQATPFQRSTRISLAPAAFFREPTSQARPFEAAATLVTVAVARPGKPTVRHLRPFQCSRTVPFASVPRTQADDRDPADTELRKPGRATLGSATLDQAAPFQCKISGVPCRNPVSASAPTAQALAGPEAETSLRLAGETTDDGTGTARHAEGVVAAARSVPAGEATAGSAAATSAAPVVRATATSNLDLIYPHQRG